MRKGLPITTRESRLPTIGYLLKDIPGNKIAVLHTNAVDNKWKLRDGNRVPLKRWELDTRNQAKKELN